MGRKLIASLCAALLITAMSMAAVSAAPVKNPHASVMTLDCEGDEYEIVVSRGNPAHVVDSTQRGIPHHFTHLIEANDEIVYEATGSVGQGKKNGLQARLVTCTGAFELDEGDVALISEYLGMDLTGMTVVEHLVVRVMITPAGPGA